MNIFNRIIMIILLLALIVFSIVSIVNIFANLFEWSTVADRILNYTQSLNPYIAALILFVILAVGLVILIFEFYRRKIKAASVSADQSGKTMVSIKTLSSQIRDNLKGIDGIGDPKVKVFPKREGIIIETFSTLSEGLNVADKTKEVREAASNFASKNLGFKVLKSNHTVTGFTPKKEKAAREISGESVKTTQGGVVSGKVPDNKAFESETAQGEVIESKIAPDEVSPEESSASEEKQ